MSIGGTDGLGAKCPADCFNLYDGYEDLDCCGALLGGHKPRVVSKAKPRNLCDHGLAHDHANGFIPARGTGPSSTGGIIEPNPDLAAQYATR